jgi:Acetyl-CoA acetyltransferase
MHFAGLSGTASWQPYSGPGKVDMSCTAVAWSGRAAFEEACMRPADIRYASIYDSFTITVLLQREDLGFCEKGQGGQFVADGQLIAGVGRLAVNTGGGSLCNDHPANRGRPAWLGAAGRSFHCSWK